MTEMERYVDRAPVAQDVAVQRLGEWAQSAQAAHSVAAELVKTSFVPEGFRGKPYEATAAILAGLELGLSPMAALRSFDVIQGQAAPRAITLRAVAQAAGHEMVLEESTATSCKMRGRRAGSSEWQTVRWTIDRAKALGVTGKNNWKTQPQAMLVARATGELARLIAADAILGIAYSAEELADGQTVDVSPAITFNTAETTVSATTGTRRMSRKKAAPDPVVVAELAAIDGEPGPVSTIEGYDADNGYQAEVTLTEPQMKHLRASYGEIGIRDAAVQKHVTSLLLGIPPIETHSTLTVEQASDLIALLSDITRGYMELVTDDEGVVTGIVHAQPVNEP